MMYAYDKKYLDDAMKNLGEAFDFAANECNMRLDEFVELFITGGFAARFEGGVPKYVCGISGIELVWDVVIHSGKAKTLPEVCINYERSPEYWCGWILAYYQWYTGYSFKNIKRYVSMDEILKLYPVLHEAAEEKFVDTLNIIISRRNSSTNLRFLRRTMGYSQKMLSEKSGVTLRMIQQYEQRAKDINKATGKNLLALAQTLGCNVEDLMEPLISGYNH